MRRDKIYLSGPQDVCPLAKPLSPVKQRRPATASRPRQEREEMEILVTN
jgi:hypothetical protein